MRKSDKLKTVEVTYFLVPFLILLIGFSVLTGLTVKIVSKKNMPYLKNERSK